MDAEKRYITVAIMAKELDVAQRRVRRWCENGDVDAFQLPSGGWKIAQYELTRILKREPRRTAA